MKILLHYLKPYRFLVFIALLLASINQIFSLFDPMIAGWMFDDLINHPKIFKDGSSRTMSEFLKGSGLFKGAAYYIGLLIATAMVSRIAKAFQDYAVSVIIQKFGAKLFTDGLRHSMQLPYQEFEDQRSGETLSILTKVRSDCEKFIGYFINVFFTIVVSIVFVSVFAFRLHWSVIPVYLGGSLLIAYVTNLLSKKIKGIQKSILGETTALAGATTESLRNIELVKSLGITNEEVKRLNNNTFKILGLELKKVKSLRTLSFIQGTMVNTLRQFITLTLLILIYQEHISGGQYMSLLFYGFFIFGPMQEIGNVILSYREAQASLENFDKVMKKPVEPTPIAPKHIGTIENLEFSKVSFKHTTAQYKALDEISFAASQGETIAFVGPSGSGKSTLVKLLVGLYRPQEGIIKYNNIAGNEINFDELRTQIGFVTQDTNLFAGTIKENLVFVNPNATEAELNDALQKASCNNLLQRAEKGIETVIGEGGLKLSGGEKQRLSIARSLLRNPKLLIFDEATSALDSITEEAITNTIREISTQQNQITVLIAHRLSTIMHANKIYVLEQGSIVETGSHESLLAEKGLYYAMWRQQIGERKKFQTT